MQDTKSIEGMSFTNFEKGVTFAPIVQAHDLRLLSVHNCEDVHLLFAILNGTAKLKRLRIHFKTECDDFLATQQTFNNDSKRLRKKI